MERFWLISHSEKLQASGGSKWSDTYRVLEFGVRKLELKDWLLPILSLPPPPPLFVSPPPSVPAAGLGFKHSDLCPA